VSRLRRSHLGRVGVSVGVFVSGGCVMSRERRLALRRARVRELRADGLSLREIADRVGVHSSTVERDLLVPVRERGQLVPNAAGPGNGRAVKSGVYSERSIAPVRERHARLLAERYPGVDPGRRAAEAQRRAMCELASDWLDRQGTVVKDDEGHAYDIAVKLAAWLSASERWVERLEAELRQPDSGGGLEALLVRGAEILEARETKVIDAQEVDDGE
jgi:lambda repressor-like predicted transcriptional regulator